MKKIIWMILPAILDAGAPVGAQEPVQEIPLAAGFTPWCSVVYRDTLFFGGRWQDKDATAAPLLAVADGRGRPLPHPVAVAAPFGLNISGIRAMAVHNGMLVVAGGEAFSPDEIGTSGMALYDGNWHQFPSATPGRSIGFT